MIAGRARLEADWFERLYADEEDPWRFLTSPYERRKYRCTLDALHGRRFARGLEVGCSIGVFTGLLADSCDRLVAIDVSGRALQRAADRLADRPEVELHRASFPEQMPSGSWDLVVCAEMLYYLDQPALDLAARRLSGVLSGGGTVLAVHWRPATTRYPFRGDDVHDLLVDRLGAWHSLDARTPKYRLDRFDGAAEVQS